MVPNAKPAEEDEADSVGRAASLRGMNEYISKFVPSWVKDVRHRRVLFSVCVCVCLPSASLSVRVCEVMSKYVRVRCDKLRVLNASLLRPLRLVCAPTS